MKGVPIGYTHDWIYTGRWRETKTAPGQWRFKYTAIKSKAESIPFYKVGIDTRIKWRIEGEQYATKLNETQYNITMEGRKTLINARILPPDQTRLQT